MGNEKQEQGLIIEKLKKERKQLQENLNKSLEDVQSSESKNNHLKNIKSKLEHTLDDLENELQKEKKAKVDAEKCKRKIEADLRINLEVVAEQEKEKNVMKQNLSRKDKELMHLSAKVEDEQILVIKYQNQLKELGGRIEDLEEEAEIERQARIKCEKQRAHLSQEIEELSEKMKDTTASAFVQADMNRRKDSEIHKLKRDLEEEHQLQEAQLDAMKNKNIQTVTETTERLDKQIKSNQK